MLDNKVSLFIKNSFKSKVFSNSFWGVFSNIFQNILFSIFFIVIARKYATVDFSNYIIANTLYGFILAFSSLGLGQWFIRELVNTEEKQTLINKFFKIQLVAGVLFYFINIILCFILYDSVFIRQLSVLIGINIIFDNIIYVIKFVNIASFEQKRTFIIFTIEATLKFMAACFLYIYQLPILYLALVLIILRFITLNLFLRIGNGYLVNLIQIWKIKIKFIEIKHIVLTNWSFIIIGSIAVIYWKVGSIVVSKLLSIEDVANFEISFKIFSIAQILPVIVSTSIFPVLVKLASNDMVQFNKYYKQVFFIYALYGIASFTFIYSFSDFLLPYIFGDKYALTSVYSKEMFLTMLVFPTALLQANVLVALNKERIDMWLNIVSLMANCLFCFIGLYFYTSLSVINYSIFLSFFIFHLIQDIFLVKLKLINYKHIIYFLFLVAFMVIIYTILADIINKYYLFFYFWLMTLTVIFIVYYFFFYKTDNSYTFKRLV